VVAAGDPGPLHRHIEAVIDNGPVLGEVLRALAAAAEETSAAADAARRVWPDVIFQVLGLVAAGHTPFTDDYFGQAALAALMPQPTAEIAFLYREVAARPVEWVDPMAWQPGIEAWLKLAAGSSQCVDALISVIRSLPAADQATLGLGWVSAVVLPDPNSVAGRSYVLSGWLIEVRDEAARVGRAGTWQRLVDALVVAGETRLAPYSE
jgi:hypothetical protein